MSFLRSILLNIYSKIWQLVILIVFAALYFAFVYYFDTRWRFIPYTFLATSVLAAVFFLFSRRFFFSSYAAMSIVVFFTFVSVAKYNLRGLALHAYDFVFVGLDFPTIIFVVDSYPWLSALAIFSVFGLIFLMYKLYRHDAPLAVAAPLRLAAMGVFATATYAAHPMHKPREASYLPYIAGYNASALPLSILDLADILGPLPLVARAAAVTKGPSVADSVNCGPVENRADTYLILSESQAAPDVFPGIEWPQQIVESFQSGDGETKPLYVETIGAGTWMTNFSVMTGLSTTDFGWQAAYVTQLMEGRIKGALPELFAACGYRTVAIMALEYESLNEGRFLKSIGFQEIYDAKATGLEPMTVRDEDYFKFAEKIIADHHATDTRPLFLHIQTMFAHQPYDFVLMPQTGEFHSYAKDDDIDEYARRVAIAREDIESFWSTLRADPGPRGSVGVEFGDHHPPVTGRLLVGKDMTYGAVTDFHSEIYRTFYAVHGFGREIDYSLLSGPLDAAFLGAEVIAAANLPTSPLYQEMSVLSDHCKGQFHTCKDRNAVDRLLKARLDSGMILTK